VLSVPPNKENLSAPPEIPAKYSANGYHLVELGSYSEVMTFVGMLRGTGHQYIFRGQSNASHPLEPSLTRLLKREDESKREQLRREHMRAAMFELRGRVEFQGDLADCLDDLSELNRFATSTSDGQPKLDALGTQLQAEFWAFGQHHGLTTPLLDWTLAPGVALFFAVEKPVGSARHMAGFYALNQTLTSARRPGPKIGTLDFVTPIRFANPRLSAQRGLFSFCSRDVAIETWVTEAFKDEHRAPAVFKLIFPLTEQDRRACLRDLRDQNITHSSIYPDVGGATQHTNLLLEEKLEHKARETKSKGAEPESPADIGLAGCHLWIQYVPGNAGHMEIRNVKLDGGDGDAAVAGWQKWKVEPVSLEGIGWKNRAGCAYLLKRVDGDIQSRLFLKTPDKRHLDYHRLADIRRSFEEEKSSLKALNPEESLNPENLNVAKVLASVEIKFNPGVEAAKNWPPSGLPALFHEHVPKTPLNTALAGLRRALTADEWFDLAETLTNTLRRVHNRSVLHAAIAHRHVLVDPLDPLATNVSKQLSGAFLVGFGSSSLLSEAGVGNANHSRPQSPWIAPEVHENEDLLGPLSFSTDVYSLGVTLLYAATLCEPDTFELQKYRHPLLLKRRVTKLLEESNKAIAARHDVAKIIDKCLRHDPHDRYSCMEELLDAIQSAKHKPLSPTRYTLTQSLNTIRSILEKASPSGVPFAETPVTTLQGAEAKWSVLNPFFQQLLQRQVDRVKDEVVDKLTHAHYEVYGHRDTLIDYLCSFMNLLKDGQTYCTVSLPGYWTDNNLGSDGRFLAKNKELLSRGVNVERVLLVPGPFVELPFAEQRVLLAHYEAWDNLPPDQRDRFRVRVAEKKTEDLMSFEKRGQAVAIIETGENKEGGIALRFLSTGTRYQHGGRYFIDRQIRKLRFQALTPTKLQDEKERMAFKFHFQSGQDLNSYIQPRTAESLRDLLRNADRATDAV